MSNSSGPSPPPDSPTPSRATRSALHDRNVARGRIGLAAIVGLPRGPVNVDEDARVVLLVGTRERDGGARGGAAAAANLELRAAHVELGGLARLGRVQRQDLDAEQVVAGRDAGGQVEVGPAVVGDEVVDPPQLGRRVKGVLPDLEPLLARLGRRRRVVDLGEPRRHGALVRLGNGVVRVAGELSAPDDVLEPGADLVARVGVDDCRGCGAGLLADDVVGCHVVHGIVVVWRAQADERALVGSIDRDFLFIVRSAGAIIQMT